MATVTVDTNVLISALIGHGKPRCLVTKLLEEQALVTSTEMLAELADVLARPKFVGIKGAEISEFLSIIASKAVVVRIRQHLKIIMEDPDDDIVLTTAYEGKANYLVSGDMHLLNLKNFRGIRIVTVKEMLDLLHDG